MDERVRDGLGMLALAGALALVGFVWGGAWFFAGLIGIVGLCKIAWAMFNPAESV